MNTFNRMRTTSKAVMPPVRVVVAALAIAACIPTPSRADTFIFETGSPTTQLASLSRRPSPGKIETETADDFPLQETTVITGAKIFGLIPSGTPLDNIRDVEVEVYQIFSDKNSDVSRTSGPRILLLPTRLRASTRPPMSKLILPPVPKVRER